MHLYRRCLLAHKYLLPQQHHYTVRMNVIISHQRNIMFNIKKTLIEEYVSLTHHNDTMKLEEVSNKCLKCYECWLCFMMTWTTLYPSDLISAYFVYYYLRLPHVTALMGTSTFVMRVFYTTLNTISFTISESHKVS